jgi:hypothetical protein
MSNSIHRFQGGGEKIIMVFLKIKESLVFILLIGLSVAAPVFAQQELQQEYVQVVNVEMILRVLKDGSPVGGLKKNDFALYEDGEKCEINGFFEVHRRIAPAVQSPQQAQQPRLYLLFFWVGNPAADVEGVLNKFFSTIYRDGDRVILSTPLKIFELQAPHEKASITAAFLEQWRQEAKTGSSKRFQFHKDLNRLFEDFLRYKKFNDFIMQYNWAVKEYQQREFSTDMTAFEAMADSLIPIKNDKFALVFFQHDTLPLFDVSTVSDECVLNGINEKTVSALEDEIGKIEIQTKTFFNLRIFSEKLRSLLIQANTQFHLLFLSPDRSDRHADVSSKHQLTKNEDIISNWDQVIREISKNTGGLMLDGDRMIEGLEHVSAFEDIYYHITYVPWGQGAKKRKIDIRVDQPGMTVLFGRTLEMKELPLVKITEISADSQLIRLGIVNFYPVSKEGVPTGAVNIYVTGRQTENEPSRLLLSQASETAGTIELPFAFPQLGFWDLEVRVVDQITGQQDVKKARVEIAAAMPSVAVNNESDPALIALLAKGAAYAEKLKKTAFGFFCREEVTEENFKRISVEKYSRHSWTYDYQIIARDGRITENRVLLKKNRESSHQEKAQLETAFRSFYSFFMPVTLLAGEKQHLYQYQLLGKEKINKIKVWRIAAVRRDPSLSIPWGEVWVDEEDGAVLKIQLEQTSIIGFERLAEKLAEQRFLPVITTIHEYNIEKNQIRFPGKTTFIERHKMIWGDPQIFLHSRTYFEYRDYRFSFVTASVEEKTE